MKRLILADVKSVNNDGKPTGHYLSLAQNYIDLYSDYVDVKIAGGFVYEQKIDKSRVIHLPFENKTCFGKIKNKLNVLKNCKFLFRNTNQDDVIVMQHSALSTLFLGLILFARKHNQVYIIAYDTDPISSFFQRIIYRFAKSKIKGFVLSSEKNGLAYGLPYCLIPDYIFAGNEIPVDKIPYEKKKYDFISIGTIWPDKGFVETAKRFAGTQYRILIAGKPCDEKIAKELTDVCKDAENIDLKLGFVNDNDYCKYMSETRFCILNYHGVYAERSSGVVLDILFAGVPVVGHRTFAMQFIEQEQLGILFDSIESLNPEMFLKSDIRESFRKNIARYLKKNIEYRNAFLKFIGILR